MGEKWQNRVILHPRYTEKVILKMQYVKPGNFISVKIDNKYYYYLVLSNSAFFGCQWAYAFHKKSSELLTENEILVNYGKGFHALIDFIEERRANEIIKINTKIDIKAYLNESNLKARIDTYGGGHLWYIYSTDFNILKKQKKLKKYQYSFPIASGMKCIDSTKLINKEWNIDQVVKDEGCGQFPI
ncbi:MAG: hypothetical protein GY829_06880 [Gammaproteobacteria bacterium]|nr:hypothetical protein [Gammaproteobacteria bacterium]